MKSVEEESEKEIELVGKIVMTSFKSIYDVVKHFREIQKKKGLTIEETLFLMRILKGISEIYEYDKHD